MRSILGAFVLHTALAFVGVLPAVLSASAAPGSVAGRIAKLAGSVEPKTTFGISVTDLNTREVVVEYNADTALTPASVQKVLTSYAALRVLGGEYRFLTEFFADRHPFSGSESSGVVGNLTIRGHGDPSFIDERFLKLGEELKALGVRQVHDVVLDTSLFVGARARLGPNPYQAGASALSADFNSVEIKVVPTTGGEKPLVSLSPGAPYGVKNSALTKKGRGSSIEISQLEKGQIVVSGTIGKDADPVSDYRTVADPDLFFGALTKHALERSGIGVRGKVRRGIVPEHGVKLYEAYSKDLSAILTDLNRHSSNFIAGQLLFALGRGEDGKYDQARGILRVKEITPFLGDYTLEDGSGLDRGNRISAKQLRMVLEELWRDMVLAPDFVASLSRYGLRGTLKHRTLLGASSVWAKTGTLDGVSSLAGYLQSGSGRRFAFSIISNGVIGKVRAIEIEDAIIKILLEG